jgi:hypothetical protein
MVVRHLLGPDGALAGGRLMVLGGPDDQAAAAPLKAAVAKARCIDLVGRVDLLLAFACLKHSGPTLGLFGPSDEDLYRPWGPNGRTVRGPRSFEDFAAIDPKLDQEISHMMDLPVATVAAAADALIAQTARDADHA